MDSIRNKVRRTLAALSDAVMSVPAPAPRVTFPRVKTASNASRRADHDGPHAKLRRRIRAMAR